MKNNKNYYVLIMAGGTGTRFWPTSTESFPKQFHDMFGTGSSLLQQTVQRFLEIIPSENIFILTSSNSCTTVINKNKSIL